MRILGRRYYLTEGFWDWLIDNMHKNFGLREAYFYYIKNRAIHIKNIRNQINR